MINLVERLAQRFFKNPSSQPETTSNVSSFELSDLIIFRSLLVIQKELQAEIIKEQQPDGFIPQLVCPHEGLVYVREFKEIATGEIAGKGIVAVYFGEDKLRQEAALFLVGPSDVYEPDKGLRCKIVRPEDLRSENDLLNSIGRFISNRLDFTTNITRLYRPEIYNAVSEAFLPPQNQTPFSS